MFSLMSPCVNKFSLFRAVALGMVLWACLAAHNAQARIVSLTPHATELLFAAGAGEQIIATVAASNYPPQALKIARLGDGLTTSVEQVLAWQPSWVVGWPSALMDQLQRLGIQTMVVDPQSLEEIVLTIQTLGKLFGTAHRAQASASLLRQAIDSLPIHSDQPPVRVLVLASADGQFALGRHALLNDALARCGAINVLAHLPSVAPQVSAEGVLASAPSLLISGYPIPVKLIGQSISRELPADALYRPGPRFIEAAKSICTFVQQVGQSSLNPLDSSSLTHRYPHD
jgi:vitamin B12 transport system substrate-binding protein